MWQLGSGLREVTGLASRTSYRSRRSKRERGPRFEFLEQRLVMSTYYVSTTGNDNNAGTKSGPFATSSMP